MGWGQDVFATLPTVKGSAYFIYVATHWGRISAEIDEYRQRVRDQKEWHEENEALLKELYQSKLEVVERELQKQAEERADLEERAKESEGIANLGLDLFFRAVFHIAFLEILYPEQAESEGKLLDPFIREKVEKLKETLWAQLPSYPPPEPTPIGSILGLADVLPKGQRLAGRLKKS